MKKAQLNSFILHPQIKCNHANKESAKLTNHDTTPTSPISGPSSVSGALIGNPGTRPPSTTGT